MLQAINILLEEEASENAQGTLQSNQRSIIFSDGYTQLNSQLSFFNDRHVVYAQFHPIQTNLLLTVHSSPKNVSIIEVILSLYLSYRTTICNYTNSPYTILSE